MHISCMFVIGCHVSDVRGHTVYKLDSDGLVGLQEQQWDISAIRALQQTFTPGS